MDLGFFINDDIDLISEIESEDELQFNEMDFLVLPLRSVLLCVIFIFILKQRKYNNSSNVTISLAPFKYGQKYINANKF